MKAAMTAGYDFKSFNGSRLAWGRLLVYLKCLDDSSAQEMSKVEALCGASAMSATDVDLDERQRYVTDRIKAFRQALIPWLSTENSKTVDMVDAMTRWYAVFAPDAPVET